MRQTSFSPGDLVRARNREWVVLPSDSDKPKLLKLRPLSGSEEDAVHLLPELETLPIEPATFSLPPDARRTTSSGALLLADALRFALRRGAGPFRSAAQIAFEPRTYQLVPLLMALRMARLRLLIADDVGIGKTIEAGLILREFMDRGEVDAFSVLCPPHLVEQWTEELQRHFGIEAVAVTASSALKLERRLPPGSNIFATHPFTVVSLDYIKSKDRRELFTGYCPDFVIVDEAHTCVGTHRSRQQRYQLLSSLAEDKNRRMIFLTATPHSGDRQAFARLLGLLDKSFESLEFGSKNYRARLARRFIQRRRIDLEDEWHEESAFPKAFSGEETYHLTPEHKAFHDAVLDYCFGLVQSAGEEHQRRRLAFWGTLAIMRCVSSSPAAALGVLRNRLAGETEAELEEQLYDDAGDDEDAVDLEPAAELAENAVLADLVRQAQTLLHRPDPKLRALKDVLAELVRRKGAHPVVFCRYIATAEYVGERLRKAFPDANVEVVTGLLTPEERRARVEGMLPVDEDGQELADDDRPRILVATDCLSEGINLQRIFNAVVHYDLSWNPIRHQQREGRINRFGQPAPEVYSVMMYSPDSAIDGAVLDVILRKAKAIREATGVTVPLPDERGPVTEALMAAMEKLRRRQPRQLTLDLRFEDGERALKQMETFWRDMEEEEKKSRSIFAQRPIRAAEVRREWEKSKRLLGTPEEALRFVELAMNRLGQPLEKRGRVHVAHIHALNEPVRGRLRAAGLPDRLALATSEPVPPGAQMLMRTHPLVATLAESVIEAALEPEGAAAASVNVGRVGAWPSEKVRERTLLLLLRPRFKLHTRRGGQRLLLAEEAALLALRNGQIVAEGEEARALLAAPAAHDLAEVAISRLVDAARAEVENLLRTTLAEFARQRAQALREDHARVAEAAREEAERAAPQVDPVLPPDVIGLFVLVPALSQVAGGEA